MNLIGHIDVRKSHEALRLAAALALLVTVGARATEATTQPGESTVIAIDLQKGQASGPRAILGGSALIVRVVGASRRPGCMLLHDGRILDREGIDVDEEGSGSVEMRAPDVRTRVTCTFVVLDMPEGDGEAEAGGRSPDAPSKLVTREIVFLPASVLADSRQRLAALKIGVIDSGGHVAALLEAEGVGAVRLKADLEKDCFSGGLVVLAGFDDSVALKYECHKLSSRVEAGMSVLVVNPPAGWSSWGIEVRQLPAPAESDVVFAEGFARVLHGEDLGAGPWRRFLAGGREQLASFSRPAGSDQTPPSPADHAAIAVATQQGRGQVLVLTVDQLDRPEADAAAHVLFNESILWILKRVEQGPKEMGR